MHLSRKQTAYRKSRKFGDIYGGRLRRRLSDNIFRRLHSLKRPSPLDALPILIEENPSRNYFFPVSARESLEALRALPDGDADGITHVWMRRASHQDLASGRIPFAEFICGSGVRVVVLYPWSKDLTVRLGERTPDSRVTRYYERSSAKLLRKRGIWYAQFTIGALRRFYIERLLYHEVGHHVDWYRRHWSKANGRMAEEAAEQYAVRWAGVAAEVVAKLPAGL